MVAGRQGQQRVWDLAERCLPASAPTRRPPEREVELRQPPPAVWRNGFA
jgi:uncharacterized protein YcaQ